jgi:PAS domain S-box-containing protein
MHLTADGRRELYCVDIDLRPLRASEAARERLIHAIEQTGEIVVITDTEGVIQYVNPAFTVVTGYSREEAIGQNPRLLKSGEHDEEYYADLWATITAGRTWHGSFTNRRKDGTLYHEDATISPVTDEAGNIVNYVAVKRDITASLAIEEEKAHLEEQVQQSQKLESIGRLAGGVAHDLNNLLSPILGYSEMLLDETSPGDESRFSLEEIVQASMRARDLVRQLLAFSRKQVLEFKPLDLNAVIENFRKLLRRTIREDVELEFELEPGLPSVSGDVGQIEQMLMNLAVNAQDAMPEGGSLTIATSKVELDEDYAASHEGTAAGTYVQLELRDTGIGMPPDVMNHIFEPFFTTKPVDKGTGLGLATVYGIIKQHGGSINVYSEPGLGTRFRIFLPLAEGMQAAMAEAANIPASTSGDETILLVEDNSQVRKLTHRMLLRHGYNVMIAGSGVEALGLVADYDGPLDLLLTDVIMPAMSGRELYDELAASYPGMKVLYMSGYSYDVIATHGIMEESVNFIEKPFLADSLAVKVRAVLDSR